MKKIYLFFCLFVISFSAFTQQTSPLESPEETFKKSLDKDPPLLSVVDEDVIVLDSIINYSYLEPLNGDISSKFLYEYNEDAMNTYRRSYRFDNNALVLHLASISSSEFYPDSIWQTLAYQSSATDTLTPNLQGYDLYNEDLFTVSYRDLWDLETQEWNKYYRSIILEQTDEYSISEFSFWVDSLSDYITTSRSENVFSGDTVIGITFIPDPVTGEFLPTYRFTSVFVEGANNFFDSQTYIDNEWVTTYRYSYQVDQTNLTAHSYTWGNWVTGMLDFIDSTYYALNENFSFLETRTYPYENGAFSTNYNTRAEYTYTPDGLTDTRTFYNANNEATFEAHYFYSTITVVDTDEPIEDFGIKLQYPNPATSNDKVQIVANGNLLGVQYHAQIYNQNGQLMAQQKVQAGDNIELASLQANGMFYIVLSDGAKKHAWKLIMTN